MITFDYGMKVFDKSGEGKEGFRRMTRNIQFKRRLRQRFPLILQRLYNVSTLFLACKGGYISSELNLLKTLITIVQTKL